MLWLCLHFGMDDQDALPCFCVLTFVPLLCANTHNSSGLICCSFPLTCAFPLLPTNGLYGSGSQSATPVGGKSTTLFLFTRCVYLYCFSSVALTVPFLTWTQKGHSGWGMLGLVGTDCEHGCSLIMLSTLLREPRAQLYSWVERQNISS